MKIETDEIADNNFSLLCLVSQLILSAVSTIPS